MNKICKICISLLMSITIISSFILSKEKVSCHEMFYNGSSGINIRWFDVLGGNTVYLKMNGNLLNGEYYSNYYYAKVAWSNATSKVYVAESDFSISNVDLCTPTKDAWKFGIYFL